MRKFLTTAIAMVAIGSANVLARTDDIPTLDVRPVCRGIANQSADPGVGEGGQSDPYQQCLQSENDVREQMKKRWGEFSAADKRHCVELAKTGGESSNTELLTCLEMARDVRLMRAAAAAASRTAKPPSPLSTSTELSTPSAPSIPSVPSTPATPSTPAASPPATAKSSAVTEKEQDLAKGEIERAKSDAQVARASEALAQRKLADTETALRRARDDVERAKADAERAKADAQAARESEATVKRQLADAEAARVAAEKKVCQSDEGQGLGSRLRRWLGRPSSPNP
jgi:hypothetical protein